MAIVICLLEMHKIIVKNSRSISIFKASNRFFFDKVNRNWESAWKQNVTPWETGKVSSPLKHAIDNDDILLKNNLLFRDNSYALIPGCGSGHDCIYLNNVNMNNSSNSLPIFSNVVGLDMSETAIDVCRKNASLHATSQLATSTNTLKFEVGNFFEYSQIDENNQAIKFNFIFDYLFFSALDYDGNNNNSNSMRMQWGKSMQRLLKISNGNEINGVLATLIFPLYTNSNTTISSSSSSSKESTQSTSLQDMNIGPPYPVTLASYEEILIPFGFTCIKSYPVTHSIKPRLGREMMAYWILNK